MRYLLFHTKSLQSGVYFTLKTHLDSDQPHLKRLFSNDTWLVAAAQDRAALTAPPRPLPLCDLGQVLFPVIRGNLPCKLTVTTTFISSWGWGRQSCGGWGSAGGGGRP